MRRDGLLVFCFLLTMCAQPAAVARAQASGDDAMLAVACEHHAVAFLDNVQKSGSTSPGNAKPALTVCVAAARFNPNDGAVLFNLGRLLEATRDKKHALVLYELAGKLDHPLAADALKSLTQRNLDAGP
jgi:hypothetical protein